MRTTIDLPDDLHRIATGLARHTGRSLGQIVADLIRRGLETSEKPVKISVSKRTGLPVVRSARPITADDVHALEDLP